MSDSQTLPVPNPYPAGDVTVKSFSYKEALLLIRLIDRHSADAAKRRGGDFILAADYHAGWTDGAGVDHEIVVPQVMLTDLASVPRLFRGLISRTGPWVEAAVVHDFLSIAWRVIDGKGTVERRRFADTIMQKAMIEAGVNTYSRTAIFGAIRAAAAFAYPMFNARVPWSDFATDLHNPIVPPQLPPGLTLP